ncbi:MAG TPA: glycerol-3-phosphate dehydrogenase [Pyrinomonadaceae bacterium]|nr:glycerol-3-phosphate dehydrogenase [Pyrinomonadaceae bacterium]
MSNNNPQFDVIVIGAGINGAGIARDAAMRGLKVLLLDKGDIGGGTSSWSTRLIHGGLRYLEHGEFRLVRESLRERSCLLNICPHLVRPLPLLVPVYEKARRGWWTIRAGMIAYDVLSFNKSLSDKSLPGHRMLSTAETLQQAPALNRDGLRGAAFYFDAQVEFAERLVLENVLSAVAHGATVLTYTRVEKLIIENGAVRGVEFTRSSSDVARQTAHAAIVINAAGPWIDQVLTESNAGGPRLIGGTKGSHLVVAPFPGAPATAIYVEAETDGRPFFIIPWNGKYLIGTTDIRYEGDLDDIQISDDEIDYLLRETNRVIPIARLTREQILYTYSGVRPLAFTGDKDAQAITRRHFIRAHPNLRGLFSIVGGKLTTYRSLAEQTVDLVLQQLPSHSDFLKCATSCDPLPGAATADFESFGTNFKQHSSLPDATNDRLLRIYGTRVSLLLDLIAEDPSLAKVFDSETGALSAEVVFAFAHEFATTLADCLLRRTMVGLNSSRGLAAVEAAGAIVRKYLGWTEPRLDLKIVAYRQEVLSFDGRKA